MQNIRSSRTAIVKPLTWTPSYINIHGNVIADRLAGAALHSTISIQIHPSTSQLEAWVQRNIFFEFRLEHTIWISRWSPSTKWYKEVTLYSKPPLYKMTRHQAVVIQTALWLQVQLGDSRKKSLVKCSHCGSSTQEPPLTPRMPCSTNHPAMLIPPPRCLWSLDYSVPLCIDSNIEQNKIHCVFKCPPR